MKAVARSSRKPLAKRKRKSHLWARHPQDWYVEPEWCSERLFAAEKFEGGILDPACGRGNIVRSARGAGLHAVGMDIVSRTDDCLMESDFLSWDFPHEFLNDRVGGEAQNLVFNPPFRHALAFVERALRLAPGKVAALLPVNWLQGDRRARWLRTTPLARVLLLAPRPSMPPGPVIEAGIAPGGGRRDFAWFVWDHAHGDKPPTIGWLHRELQVSCASKRVPASPLPCPMTDVLPGIAAPDERSPGLLS